MVRRGTASDDRPGSARLWTAVRRLLTWSAALCVVAQPGGLTPYVHASPDVPDIDSLIDDSGPVPNATNHVWAPDLLFNTASGLRCKKSLVKVMWQVVCAGDLPGSPPGTRAVTLDPVSGLSLGPAKFWPGPEERWFTDTGAQGPVLLPPGHKMVFYAFSSNQTLVCGVPPTADLVCMARSGSSDTNGFVIASPRSWVF